MSKWRALLFGDIQDGFIPGFINFLGFLLVPSPLSPFPAHGIADFGMIQSEWFYAHFKCGIIANLGMVQHLPGGLISQILQQLN